MPLLRTPFFPLNKLKLSNDYVTRIARCVSFFALSLGALFIGACSHMHSSHHDQSHESETARVTANSTCESKSEMASGDGLTCGPQNECANCSAIKKFGEAHGKHHHASMEKHSDAMKKGSWNKVEYYYRMHTFFSGALESETIPKAKEDGVKVIINLQDPSELNWDEKVAVESSGIKYYSIPVNIKDGSIDAQTMKEVDKVFMKHHTKGEKVVVHCTSGARVAAWYAYHLNKIHGDKPVKAIAQAREIGLSEAMEKAISKALN